ncbi:MAG: putative two-component system sensor kinase [Verrucomicrobiales bacterium]|nr:putative two-component system sensor kinase [Verrucomicrobiales bacterium]
MSFKRPFAAGFVSILLLLLFTHLSSAAPQGIKPVDKDGRPLNFDFEDGTLKDWTSTGDAFEKLPVQGDVTAARGVRTEHQGNYWIGTYEGAGDTARGTLTSVPFKVTHPFAGFLVGGGSGNQTFVELVYADTQKVFFKARGNQNETFRWVVVDMRPDQGREIFIRIVDQEVGTWGHINFDNFEFYSNDPTVLVSPRRDGNSRYSSRTWQAGDGLPHNTVWGVVQTHDGYIWAGTPQGLARFDGQRFVVFHPETADGRSAPGIRFLHETKDGTLWIAPESGGLISLRNGNFARELPALVNQVKSLFGMRDGSLWIGTTNGVIHYQNGSATWLTTSNGLAGDVILSIGEDQKGNPWFGTDGGLTCLKNGVAESIREYGGQPIKHIKALVCTKDNSVWFGTSGGGVGHLKEGALHFYTKFDGLADNFVSTISEDHRGTLWIGTMSGLSRRVGERFVTEVNHEGTSYETVFCFTEDHEGSVWIGTKEGLNQLQFKAFESFTKEQKVPHNNIMSVCEDHHGTVWAATWGGGLCGLRDGEVTVQNKSNSPLDDVLLAVHETRDGSLWLGVDFDGGIYRFKDGGFTHFTKEEGLTDPAVRVLYEDRAGNLWIGTRQALCVMKDGKFQRFTTADGLAGPIIRAIFEDREGSLWIGTNDGLTRRRDGKFSNFTTKEGLSNNRVVSFYEDANNFWIGTEGGGLNRLPRESNYSTASTLPFTAFTTAQGLFSDSIFEILEDDRGYFWMSCFSGVFRVQKKALEDFDSGKLQTVPCASFGKTDGMSSVQCNGVGKPAGCKGKDGRLWFPTTRGIVVVDPSSIRDNDPPPRLVIEDMVADKKTLTQSLGSGPLIIPAGRGDLEFNYAALSFRAPDRNRFKYKLEGFDTEWIDAKNRRTAYYNNIKPREYTFRVTGCNNDGVWNETEATLSFVILPHFWQSKWFIGLVAIMAVGAVAGTARYVTWKKVRGKLIALEQQHAVERERTRIARDMHDDLGARLTEILMLSNLAKSHPEDKRHIDKISGSANEVVRNLDAMVWAVDPGKDSLENLAFYLQEYAEMFLSATSIRCRLDVPTELPHQPISSDVRHNIFMVVKEALNNAVKYSGATEVSIHLGVVTNRLLIMIEDNGKGFDRQAVSSSTNGLLNMEKRMNAINGEFTLCTKPGQGTRIDIAVCFDDSRRN